MKPEMYIEGILTKPDVLPEQCRKALIEWHNSTEDKMDRDVRNLFNVEFANNQGVLACYNTGVLELRHTTRKPTRCFVLPTRKTDIFKTLLDILREVNPVYILQLLSYYRKLYDFSNYNPTEFYISREGKQITLKFKHEYPFDMFSVTDPLVLPGVSGGLHIQKLDLLGDIEATTRFEDEYTIITINSTHADPSKQVLPFQFKIDSYNMLAKEPADIVEIFYNWGIIDSPKCVTPRRDDVTAQLHFGIYSPEMGDDEKLCSYLSEIIFNCIMYQHAEDRTLLAYYDKDLIMFYRIHDEEKIRELSPTEIDMFFEDLQRGVDFKRQMLRCQNSIEGVKNFA